MDLPIELVRDILELAAADPAHSLAWISGLALVCRAAHAWVQPILYHTLCVDQHNQDAFFALLREKPPEFFAAVRHLVLTWALPPRDLQSKFLVSFAHVRVVSVHSRYLKLLSTAPNFRPTHVFVTSPFAVDIFLDWRDRPLVLSAVTHLRVRSQSINQTGWTQINNTLMPALTHICLDISAGLHEHGINAFKQDLSTFLALVQCTRVVVRYSVRSKENWAAMFAALRSLNDPRVHIYRVRERYLGDAADWLEFSAIDARTGVDPWSSSIPVCTSVTSLALSAA